MKLKKEREIKFNKKLPKFSYKNYYSNFSHSELPTEHEATLIAFFEKIRDKNYNSAVKELLFFPEYFQFTHKDYLKKAYKYGLTNQELQKIKNEFSNILNEKLQNFKNEILNIGEYFSYFLNLKYSIMMIFSNNKIFFQKLYNEFKNLSEKDIENINRRYNIFSFEYQFKKIMQ